MRDGGRRSNELEFSRRHRNGRSNGGRIDLTERNDLEAFLIGK
jgi:hypothetical protein